MWSTQMIMNIHSCSVSPSFIHTNTSVFKVCWSGFCPHQNVAASLYYLKSKILCMVSFEMQ